MMKRRQPRGHAVAALGGVLFALAAALPDGAAAQASGQGFLFKTPSATLGVRVGFAQPRTQSEVFSFTREQLTLDGSAFDGATLGAQLGLRVTDRVELAVDVQSMRSETRTEFRDWVDVDDQPIEQTTYFDRVPLSLGAKLYLTDRGRSIGRFVWIPTKVAPYVGAGVGVTWYVFEQQGDWVDSVPDEDGYHAIFTDTFREDGSAGTVHLMGGFDVSLSPRFLLNTEARYQWAKGPMDSADFVGFDDIDLSGLLVTAGISVRF